MSKLIYQTAQLRELEQQAQTHTISGDNLMERAGKAAAELLFTRWPQVKKVTVFCGSGNNGGDGYIFAKLVHERGARVMVYDVAASQAKSEAQTARALCQKAGVNIQSFTPQVDLADTDVLVDALLGIGMQGEVKPDYAAVIEKMNASGKPILALDIPSGIDANTGKQLGIAVQADATLTFIGLKLGLLTGAGIGAAGELFLDELQLPHDLFAKAQAVAEKLDWQAFNHTLKKRGRDWHKGLSGHVLIIGGELGYSGAPRMAAEAALRVGAGLATIATVPENALVMNINCPEIMCHGIEDPEEIRPFMEQADTIILGPGLRQTEWAKSVYEIALTYPHPMVVDADALNLLALSPQQKSNWILTPHPGEASRLLQKSIPEVQEDRLTAAKEIVHRYSGICVLKGAGTIVYSEENLPGVCDKGNPGMATAGMGDVLSGVIGGLVAQGVEMHQAAKFGVYMHALAGDCAAERGERGLMAMDLMPFIRQFANEFA